MRQILKRQVIKYLLVLLVGIIFGVILSLKLINPTEGNAIQQVQNVQSNTNLTLNQITPNEKIDESAAEIKLQPFKIKNELAEKKVAYIRRKKEELEKGI